MIIIIIVVNFSAFLFIFLFFIILVSQNLLSFFKKYLALSGSIGVARIFDWGGAQTANHMQWRYQKLRNRNFLWEQKYRRM